MIRVFSLREQNVTKILFFIFVYIVNPASFLKIGGGLTMLERNFAETVISAK